MAAVRPCKRGRHGWQTPTTRDDRGAALVLAIMLVLMATLIGVTAESESLNGIISAGVTTKNVQVAAGDRAGVDAMISTVEADVESGAAAWYCPAGTYGTGGYVTLNSASGGAADAASAQSYAVSFAEAATPSAAVGALSASPTKCAGPSTPVPVYSSTSPWYLAISAQGRTAASFIYNGTGAEEAVVEISPTSVPTFKDGVYAGQALTMNGDFVLNPSSTPSQTYTTGTLGCQNTGDYYTGDVWAGATGDLSSSHGSDGTSGSCVIDGNLYVTPTSSFTNAYPGGNDPSAVAGSLNFTASTHVTGTVYVAGTGLLSTGGNVTLGGIVTNGSVTLTSGTVVVNSGIYAMGNVTLTLNSGSQIDGPVYSADGTVTVDFAGGTIDGYNSTATAPIYSNTPWPTSPSPCVGSDVTCVGGGMGIATPFPSQAFPSLTYIASDWPGWTVWKDPYDSTSFPGGCTSNVNGNGYSSDMSSGEANYRYAAGVATAAVYNEMATATSPTVIETPCAMEFDDAATNGQLQINTDIAVFADGGFYFDNWAPTAIVPASSVTGKLDLYLVVPYSGSGPYPVNGEPVSSSGSKKPPTLDGTSCPPGTGTPNTFEYSGGKYAAGDIWLKSGLPSTVEGLFYTPDNMCTSGTPQFTGQVYVGGYISTGNGWTMTADPSMSSLIKTSVGGGWSSSVDSIR